MKIETFKQPKSSFLSLEKDLELLVNKILANKNLKKLLYYTTSDALSRPNITEEQSADLFKNNIKIVPKLYVDGSVLQYIVITFDNFIMNMDNPEFRDNMIVFDIVCHYDQWQLEGFQLRPYRIAAELDWMLDKQRLTGIGKTEFVGAKPIVVSDEFAGLSIIYRVVHGEEDKKFMPNPEDEPNMIDNFIDTIKHE